MAEQAGSRLEEVPTGLRRETQVRHEQEERQHPELVAAQGVEHDDAGLDQRRLQAEREGETADSGQPERHSDRRTAHQQRESGE